jgi:hypothetical protein
MRRIIATGLALTLSALLSAPVTANDGMDHGHGMGDHGKKHHDHEPRLLLAFKSMYGVDGPFLGEANAIRGVVGDEAPWEIARSVKGFLSTDGHLVIWVRGLVFKDDPAVPPDLVGKNDETEFRGLVSCLTEDEAAGTTPTVNVVTKGFPANMQGDSFIDAHVQLPNPCVAPVVFVLAGSEDKWFSVTGFESAD